MKNFKFNRLYLSLLTMFIFTTMITSCEKEIDRTEDTLIQTGDFVEENASYKEFLEIDKVSDLYTVGSENGQSLSKGLNIDNRSNICTVCNPNIYSFSVYNLGGNNRGFGISGGRNHPCSYELIWGPTPEYTVNWASGPFAHITFPGPGTYDVWVNLKSGTGASACIIAEYVTVTI